MSAAKAIPYSQEVFRKLIHLSSLWMVILIYFFPWDRILLFYLFATLLILNLLCEFAYSCKMPVITPLYQFFFGKMLRDNVRRGQWVVSGGPPVFAAAALVSFFFVQVYAAAGLGVMLIADTAAALVGRKFGRHRAPNGKSWEGFAAFCVSGTLFAWGLLAFAGEFSLRMFAGALLGTVLAALAELFEKQLHVDDNLSIPLIVGGILTATQALLF